MASTFKLNNLQILRAFAAVAVVYYHTGFRFPHMDLFGSFGVDVFFVISGYIMARILDPANQSSQFFLRRRILRIVPPYWALTLLLFLVALRFPQMVGNTRPGAVELAKSLLFIPFTKYSWVIQPILFIGWSLNYEVFFYVALAAGILINARKKFPLGPILPGSILVLLTMGISYFFRHGNVIARFYSRDIVFEFILGIIAYYICKLVASPGVLCRRGLLLASAIACGAALITVQGLFPQLEAARVLALGIPSCLLVISCCLLSEAGWDAHWTLPVLIGDASYILYLVHPYCEFFDDRIVAAHLRWLHIDTAIGAPIAIAFALLVAIPLHLYAERPVMRFLNRRFCGKRVPTEFAQPVG